MHFSRSVCSIERDMDSCTEDEFIEIMKYVMEGKGALKNDAKLVGLFKEVLLLVQKHKA